MSNQEFNEYERNEELLEARRLRRLEMKRKRKMQQRKRVMHPAVCQPGYHPKGSSDAGKKWRGPFILRQCHPFQCGGAGAPSHLPCRTVKGIQAQNRPVCRKPDRAKHQRAAGLLLDSHEYR